jgi:hypothetical protein
MADVKNISLQKDDGTYDGLVKIDRVATAMTFVDEETGPHDLIDLVSGVGLAGAGVVTTVAGSDYIVVLVGGVPKKITVTNFAAVLGLVV